MTESHGHPEDPLEIHIEPHFDALEVLGIALEDLEEALPALDDYHDRIEGQADAAGCRTSQT